MGSPSLILFCIHRAYMQSSCLQGPLLACSNGRWVQCLNLSLDTAACCCTILHELNWFQLGIFALKERLVARLSITRLGWRRKGFHQQPHIDYTEKFSTIIKPTTIRVVLSLEVTFQWPLWNLMHKMHFYMFLFMKMSVSELPGLIDPQYPHHVFKIFRSTSFTAWNMPELLTHSTWFHKF